MVKLLVFAGLSTFQVLAYLRRGLVYIFLSLYLHYFLGMSVTLSTLFVTFSMIASSLGQATIWGWLADQLFNRKHMVVWSEIVAGLGHILLWWLHRLAYDNYSPMAAAWVITAGMTAIEAFWGASNVGWASLMSDISPEGERSTLFGRLSAIGGFGRIMGVIAASVLYSAGGFAGGGFYHGQLFFITAAIIVASALLMHWTVRDEDLVYRRDQPRLDPTEDVAAPNLLKYFDKRYFLLFLLALAAINLGRNSIVLISNFYLKSRFAATDAEIGLVEASKSFSIILAGFLTPYIVRRFSDWGLFLGSVVFVMVLLVSFVLAPTLWLALLIGAGIWLVHVTLEATSYSIVAELVPASFRGRYFGIYNTVFFVSWGLGGSLVTGPTTDLLIFLGYDPVIAYTVAFIVAALLVALGLVLGLYLFKNRPQVLAIEPLTRPLAEVA